MNLNKVFIIGNLTRDPELRALPSGTSVASFGVATNRIWKNQQGEKQEDVQYHNIVVFGKQADTTSQYLKKGNSVLIEGRIQTRSWEAQDGTKRNRVEIVAERVQFGPKKTGDSSSREIGAKKQEEDLETIEYPEEEINPEEIPF